MSEPAALPPREYAVWLRASELPAGPAGGALGDVMTDLALEEALLHAWLDEQAQRTLHLRIGRRDLAAIQGDIDASMRALLRRALEHVGPAARAALETALAFQGYFPMSPLGRALATHVEIIVSDTARGKQPAAWAGEKGLVARAIYRVNGTLSISPPTSRAGAREARLRRWCYRSRPHG